MTDAVRRFWSGLLIVVGGLMTALCGTCTAFYVVAGIVDASHPGPENYGGVVLVAALILGGLPTLVGVLLLWWGLRLRKASAPTA